MTRATAVRRLALDINPWVWAYVALMLCLVLELDQIWFGNHDISPPLMPAALLFIGTASSAQKVPSWRILPVSRVEIDRARWWQVIAAPALLLCLTGLGCALALDGLGYLHTSWPEIAATIFAQAGLGILLAAVTLVGFPFAAQKVGRWSMIFLIVVVLPFWGLPHLQSLPNLYGVLGGLAAVTAIALYALAGRWPAPLTTTLWNLPAATSSNKIAASAWRGWPVLVLGSFPIFVPIWAMVAGIPILMAYVLPHMDIRFMALILSVAPSQWAVVALATAMRTLRALPLAGWQLACRLALLLLLVQAVSLACLEAATIVTGGVTSPGLLVAALAYPLLYFPCILRFPRLIPFGGALTIFLIVPFQFLVFYPQITLWLALASLAAMALGLRWTWHEVVHGRSAYQVRPLVPSRWRGLG